MIDVAPNTNPLAPGPGPGIPIFEWHAREVSCGAQFTDAEAEEAEKRRREEERQKELRARRQQESSRRVSELEREQKAALAELPAIDRPSPVKEEIQGQGCGIGCGLWIILMAVWLTVLKVNGQLETDTDPALLGIENPLLFLPATWFVGWIIASLRLRIARRRHLAAEAEATRRADEHARVRADYDERIAAARLAARQ
jgi:uncharacterized Zn finger protein (UPF0148 family)